MSNQNLEQPDSEDEERAEAKGLAANARPQATKVTVSTIRGDKTLRFQSTQDELNDDTVRLRRKELTVRLRKNVAWAAIWFVGAQLVMSNVLFSAYVFNNVNSLDSAIMIAWLTATVVEVIGILGIVTISLFPNKSGNQKRKRWDRRAEDETDQ